MATPGPGRWKVAAGAFPPTFSMSEHWEVACSFAHPINRPPELEPGLVDTLHAQSKCHHHLASLRHAVVQEVRALVEQWRDHTENWAASLHPSVRAVYTANNTKPLTQIPVFIHLLKEIGFQGVGDLEKELTQGFCMVGPLAPGVGWLPRTDERYSNPLCLAEFGRLNIEYVKNRLARGKPSPHWQTMLQELLGEKAKGRVAGPFQCPVEWQAVMVGVDGHPCLQLPTQHARAAVCFAVEQADKVRRCEDFRRSWHNATISTRDTPHHHDVSTYVQLVQMYHQLGHSCVKLWGQDLDAAYRQLPLVPDCNTFTILHTGSGPTLWQHRAAPFGATASVWVFNRFADAMTVLSRRLLLSAVCHFVDDFTCIDDPDGAASSFRGFKELFSILGLDMKESKEQEPNPRQKVLGVYMEVKPDHIVLEACPERQIRTLALLRKSLASNNMTAHEAQHCAGKLAFLASTFFGSVGKAACQRPWPWPV